MESTTTTTRRKVFNLGGFIEDLTFCVDDRPEMIDDIVQTYKDFLSHTHEPLLTSVKSYVDNHVLVIENEKVRSFIVACHKLNFEK